MSPNATPPENTEQSESRYYSARGSQALSYTEDGLLHLWECTRLLTDEPDYLRCGYIATGPGKCPYSHPEPVELTPLVAVVQCSDCGVPIPRDDSRAPDGRLICGQCALGYLGKYEEGCRS